MVTVIIYIEYRKFSPWSFKRGDDDVARWEFELFSGVSAECGADESHDACFAWVSAMCGWVDGDPVFRCN